MPEVLQANIFFFITSIAVVVVTIFVGVGLFYFISILRNVKHISDKLRRGADVVGSDLSEARKMAKRGRNSYGGLLGSFLSFFFGKQRSKTSKRDK